MLKRFAVKNYRGFAERIELDLSRPSNYNFNTSAIRSGIVKNGIVYGPNGSGKTNFSLAIFDIINHLSDKWKKPDYYKNFVCAGRLGEPVEFEYLLDLAGQTLEYDYRKNANGELLTERLMVNGKQVFHRDGVFEIDGEAFPMAEDAKERLRSSANNVSVVKYLLMSYPLPQGHYLLALQKFVDSMLWFRCLDTREFIGLDNGVVNFQEYIIKNQLVGELSKFLEEVSGQCFDFVVPATSDKVLMCRIGDGALPFTRIMSTGTDSLFLLFYWLQKMKGASFVFIDEFDAFYHFRLSFAVCKRLFALDCQVFTSSHNTYLMTNDLLRPDCNFILNGNVIKPLCDCTKKELRFGHNIEKLYRGNTFSV
ncbi:MAG: AAA family ATPase [Prevotellaceae bacterium]|nr:AAA family ATPase [Prevotellaceae bacterium]